MFNEFNWIVIATSFAGLALGIVLRFMLPYLFATLESYRDTGKFLEFDTKYLASSAIAVLEAVVACIVGDLLGVLDGLTFHSAIVYGFVGDYINREVVKRLVKSWK